MLTRSLFSVAVVAAIESALVAEEPRQGAAPGASTVKPRTPLDEVSNLFGEPALPAKMGAEDHEDASVADVSEPATANAVAETAEEKSAESVVANADDQAPIETDYASAVREAQLKNRPLLVVLGAQWCTWCHKLEAELKTAEAKSILNEWIVVHVDIDNEPGVASQLEVSALPALRIVGPFEAVVASREGYLEIAELQQWLAENRTLFDWGKYKVLYDTAAPDDAAIEQLISVLLERSPRVRAAAIDRLAAHPRVTAGPLIETLKTGRLIQQLSAGEVLRKWQAPLGVIDPWQPETLQADHFATLVQWARQQSDAADSEGGQSGDREQSVK